MVIFFFKQKTAYDMRISDWSSDVCSSDLRCSALRPCAREKPTICELDLVDPVLVLAEISCRRTVATPFRHPLPLRGRSRAAPFFSRWSEVRKARSDIPHHRNGNMRKMKARHGKNLVQPLTRQTVCSALERPPREYAEMRPSVPGSLASNGQDCGIHCQRCQSTGQDIPAGSIGL